MTQKLLDIKGDLYSKAEEFYINENLDAEKALSKLVEVIEDDLFIQNEHAMKLGNAILNNVIKKFTY